MIEKETLATQLVDIYATYVLLYIKLGTAGFDGASAHYREIADMLSDVLDVVFCKQE